MFFSSLTCILFQAPEWYQTTGDLKIVELTADPQKEIDSREKKFLKIGGKEQWYLEKVLQTGKHVPTWAQVLAVIWIDMFLFSH